MSQAKTIMYMFPDASKSGMLKVFQDQTSQIRGFYFSKSNIKNVEELDYVNNYAVYFLFENNSDNPQVYIGQSENGISRIKNHVSGKNFWNFCIMFVTDNNQFDKTCIDYLEWYFINLFKGTIYNLDNSQERIKEPNIDTSFTKPTIVNYAKQIEFMLEANGINLNYNNIVEDFSNVKIFEAGKGIEAKLYIFDGDFILKSGSIIKRPPDARKEWNDGGRFYNKFSNKFDELVESNNANLIDENLAKLTDDLKCSSPSYAGALCTGYSTNGWEFWQGLSEER